MILEIAHNCYLILCILILNIPNAFFIMTHVCANTIATNKKKRTFVSYVLYQINIIHNLFMLFHPWNNIYPSNI